MSNNKHTPETNEEIINNLLNGSFEGWSDDTIQGYKTACISIRELLIASAPSLKAENQRLREALDEIVNPIKMQERAKDEGSIYKLTGYIAGDTFKSKGNSHFADIKTGDVVCGTKNTFGMDCSLEVRFVSIEEFYTDMTIKFGREDKLNLRRNHVPLARLLTCKKCLKYLNKALKTPTV